METKKVLIIGSLALIAILGMRTCNQNAAPTDAATSESSAVVKEVEKKKEAPAKEKPTEKVAKKASTTKAAPKKPAVEKAASKPAKAAEPEAAFPAYENNRTRRITFDKDAK